MSKINVKICCRQNLMTFTVIQIHSMLGIHQFLSYQQYFDFACSLCRQAPLCLADDCCLVSDSTRHSLQSTDVPTGVLSRTLSSYGDRTSTAAEPHLWNSLPVQLRNPDITYTDCWDDSWRAIFFSGSMNTALWLLMRRLRKTLTYLLKVTVKLKTIYASVVAAGA